MQDRGNECCGSGGDQAGESCRGRDGAGGARPCCPQPAPGQPPEPCCSLGAECSAPQSGSPELDRPYVAGFVSTPAGAVPVAPTELTAADRRDDLKARWGIGRMRYRVEPGLYAVGNPDPGSPVLVTANYKLTFDYLRRELTGLDAYVMVLDTRGINVWCAAGKGTFGTAEVVRRLQETRLDEVVSHRNLILPQLSATGVAAHEVRKLSGFKVTFGPIRSSDIMAFLAAGMVAAPGMRRIRFSMADRLALAPTDVIQWFKYLAALLAVFFALSGIDRSGYSAGTLLSVGPRAMANLVIAYLGANVLGPMLLPWLPGRAFALKGFVLGGLLFLLSYAAGLGGANFIECAGWVLIISAVSSFIVMNFTGSSTYTSLTGVRREMVYAVPFQAMSVILGVVLWMIARFI